MATQARRAALLKAVGATPRFVATITLAEYLTFGLAAGAVGLVAGAYLAPVLAQPVSGVLGTAPVVPPSPATVALVLGTAVLLMGLPTLVATVRAVRASTVRSLANPARTPRRSPLAVAASRWLSVPLLLGVRLAARRPGRAMLAAAGLSVTVAAVVVALWMEAGIRGDTAQVAEALGQHAVTYDKLRLVIYSFIAALVVLALVNAILVAWTTALDNARTSALARALGATPGQVTAGLTVASVLPAVAALAAGIPAGFAPQPAGQPSARHRGVAHRLITDVRQQRCPSRQAAIRNANPPIPNADPPPVAARRVRSRCRTGG
jgi:putative ABC transport system permease protein